jgi:hypothetical protein
MIKMVILNHKLGNKKLKTIMKTKTSVFSFFKKMFTYNYCDTCGFTKDKVYVTELCMEAGIIQCDKCSDYNNEYRRV